MKINIDLIHKYPFTMACFIGVLILYITLLLHKNGFGPGIEITLTEGIIIIFSTLMVFLGIFVKEVTDIKKILKEVKQ